MFFKSLDDEMSSDQQDDAQVLDCGVSIGAAYPVKVTYSSLTAAIKAGKYECVYGCDCGCDDCDDCYYCSGDHYTAEQSEPTDEVIVDAEFVLYRPNRWIESGEVITEITQMDLRSATLQELCAFGEKYPDVWSEFPVVALGSIYRDDFNDRNVPCLNPWDARSLDMELWDIVWEPDIRFLTVRK